MEEQVFVNNTDTDNSHTDNYDDNYDVETKKDIDDTEFNKDSVPEDVYTGYKGEITDFETFKKAFPSYLDDLNDYVKMVYNTYTLVYKKARIRLKIKKEQLEFAKTQAFGMLLRHCMEVILTNILTEKGIDVDGKNTNDKILSLRKLSLKNIDEASLDILDETRNITNAVAHPHVISKNGKDFEGLVSFYKNTFEQLLVFQIKYVLSSLKESNTPKAIKRERKRVLAYLKMLKKEIDKFSIFRTNTNVLLQGCLIRHLTECSVNLWSYNFGQLPTDVSTESNQISISGLLRELVDISRKFQDSSKASKSLTRATISNLYDLKNSSNKSMHVTKNGENLLPELKNEYFSLIQTVEVECAPGFMKNRSGASEKVRIKRYTIPVKKTGKSPTLQIILCSFFGWFGIHKFYSGQFFTGILYLLTRGFIIGPALDLLKMLFGKFRNPRMRHNALSFILNLLFLAAHIVLITGVVTFPNFNIPEFTKNLLEEKQIYTFSNKLVQCDAGEMDTSNKLAVTECTATSFLVVNNGYFSPQLCIDGNYNSCWQDGSAGNGIGEILTFTFAQETEISGIVIHNGQTGNDNNYFNNGRVKRFKITINNKAYRILLEDSEEEKYFKFDKPVSTSEIIFTVEAVYDGAVWNDLCISEVEFYS